MSPRKKKSSETVQETLNSLVDKEKKGARSSKKPSSKKKAASKKKTTSKKKTRTKSSKKKSKSRKTKSSTKTAGSKKSKKTKKPSKKSTSRGKTTSKKKRQKKKSTRKKKSTKRKPKKTRAKRKKSPASESDFSLRELPGVGSKLEERLISVGYKTVEQISRARSKSLAKKVDGISATGAKNLVNAAKALVKSTKKKEKARDDTDRGPGTRYSLTDIPGIGKKLAGRLESAGYDSVARISRSQPSRVASSVEGVGAERANKLVLAAKDLIKAQQLAEATGGSSTKAAAKKTSLRPKEKPSAKKKTPPRKKKSKKKKAKKKTKSKPKALRKKKAKKSKRPKTKPKKKKSAVVRKKSGLTIPKSVSKLKTEMKRKWRAAEKREADLAAGKISEEDIVGIKDTVEVVSLGRNDLQEKIVDTALEILNETMVTGRPVFEIPSRSSDNIVWDEIRDLLLLGMRTISRPYHSLGSVVDATRTARVLEIVYELLKSNLHASKREVFYSDVNLFRAQKYSDKIIEDIAAMLKTTRDSIHVVASARGSAMGRVIVRDGGDEIDLTRMGTGGWAITPFLDQVEIVESDAEYILLSEKDAAVMRLAEAKYWNRQPCIILTGKGSGDIATRAFLRMLVKELEIPAFALVDSDPYGHYIYSVFLRGSKRLSYESPFIATPELKLLGVLSRDLDEYKIPKAVRIPMERNDEKRVRDMLKEPFINQNKEWVKDLRLMLQMKEKAEIQAFASHSFRYLTDEYLPRKLETADWI